MLEVKTEEQIYNLFILEYAQSMVTGGNFIILNIESQSNKQLTFNTSQVIQITSPFGIAHLLRKRFFQHQFIGLIRKERDL